MKKLINSISDVIPEFLTGLVTLNPGLSVLGNSTTVVRSDIAESIAAGLVSIISGGGSGHEPAHGGYVGAGMLSAAVAGEVFTSPSTDAVLEAIRAVATPAGVLLIVKNYTGDRLNFGLAAEIARAEGVPVEMVVVADDVALSRDGDHAGRRGLAGVVFVHKIAGAAASAGGGLLDIARIAREAAANLGTMGVALTACTVPAAGVPSFVLEEDEMEWGLGIHGEAGVQKSAIATADVVAERLLSTILADLALQPGDRVAVLVNNLGGTAAMDLAIVAGSTVTALNGRGITVERAWAGTFLTALEMAGCSITVLRLTDERLELLDATARTSAWPAAHLGRVSTIDRLPIAFMAEPAAIDGPLNQGSAAARTLLAVCDALIDAEADLTELDRIVGDGDLGTSLARAARGIQEDAGEYPSESSPSALLASVSATVRRVVGGTSGPLYSVMLLRAAMSLEDCHAVTDREWAAAFTAGVGGIMDIGGARPGDGTMLDALEPASRTFASAVEAGASASDALGLALEAARLGTEKTAGAISKRGRASYAGDRTIGHLDPGARAVVVWLDAISTVRATAKLSQNKVRG